MNLLWNKMSQWKSFFHLLCLLVISSITTLGCSENMPGDSGVATTDTESSSEEKPNTNNEHEDTGHHPDMEDIDPMPIAAIPSGGSISKKYHLPFHSGERYKAETYSGHGEAWDFNLYGTSGNTDCGEPIIAVADGTVTGMVNTADSATSGWGNYVVIDHDSDSYYSRYAHLDEIFVVSGQWVERGQAIGTLGGTGSVTFCHLHFQVEDSSGTTYNPKFHYYKTGTGKKVSAHLTHGHSYTSYNHGEIASARSRNGKSKVGTATSVTASRVASDGFSKSFSGGTYGNCAIYYEALGCDGGDSCPSGNNTNDAWLVRGDFYSYYYSCGGPSYCALGFPTGDQYSVSGGKQQDFENGYLLYSSSSGSVTAHY